MLTERITIPEYIKRIKDIIKHLLLLPPLIEMILDYVRPGFTVSPETLSDLCHIAPVLICNHQLLSLQDAHCRCLRIFSVQPEHFLRSRYKTLEFQQYVAPNDNWYNIGNQCGKIWNAHPLISDSPFMLYEKDEITKITEWKLL